MKNKYKFVIKGKTILAYEICILLLLSTCHSFYFFFDVTVFLYYFLFCLLLFGCRAGLKPIG